MSGFNVSLCGALVALASTAASAQVFYEPVQYQYSAGGRNYYYGGHDWRVHARANQLSREPGYGRTNGYAFHSGNVDTHREVSTEAARTYTDMIPNQNARYYGYTADDARNAAYANAATYWRKRDIVATARVQEDGTWVVPAHAKPAPTGGTIEIRPYRGPATTQPKPILIIPKRLLDKPLWGPERSTADVR